jgi:hypothetical protein
MSRFGQAPVYLPVAAPSMGYRCMSDRSLGAMVAWALTRAGWPTRCCPRSQCATTVAETSIRSASCACVLPRASRHLRTSAPGHRQEVPGLSSGLHRNRFNANSPADGVPRVMRRSTVNGTGPTSGVLGDVWRNGDVLVESVTHPTPRSPRASDDHNERLPSDTHPTAWGY